MNAEEELQKKIHAKELDGLDENDPEIIAYSIVFQTLVKARDYSASTHLADDVIKRLEKEQKRSFLTGDFFWLCVGIALLLTGGAYTVMQLKFKIDFGFLAGFAYKGVIIFGICFITILNYIDRHIVRKNKNLLHEKGRLG